MPARVKSIAITGDGGQVINRSGAQAGGSFATDILGFNVHRLRVRLETEGAELAGSTLPDRLPAKIRFRDPGAMRPPLPQGTADATFTLRRIKGTNDYEADVSLARLAFLLEQDQTPEVATIVREGGTSDAKFRETLAGAGWSRRGAGIMPDKGKPDITGSLAKEQPDALTLFKAGGVAIAEVFLAPAAGVEFDPALATWAFIQNPADVVFYSGHGLLWTGTLVRSRGLSHDFDDWLAPDQLLKSWENKASGAGVPFDIDALIINGCSVLFWNSRKDRAADRENIGLPWAELLYGRKGPLQTILGYRYRAPSDEPMGNRVALEMAQAIANDLGDNYAAYARRWLEINARIGFLGLGACAIDLAGYWYLNTLNHEGAGGTPIMAVGYDPKQPTGTVMGPDPLP